MDFSYENVKIGARFELICGAYRNSNHRNYTNELQFIWNNSNELSKLKIGLREVEIPPQSIICTTYLDSVTACNSQQNWIVLRFNREFYCVHTYDSEVSCNGLLFFGSNQLPIIRLTEEEYQVLENLVRVLCQEFLVADTNQEEMLRILLKRFIIRCTRLAKRQLFFESTANEEINLIRQFNILVEQHFKTIRQVKQYADLLNKSPKTIANIFSKHSEISPLQIIHRRLAIEAERLLLYTKKSAKEIGFELGFEDSIHFSRFFKNITGMSITDYRRKLN